MISQYDDKLLPCDDKLKLLPCDDQELVTEDLQFENPLLRLEGWQEIEHLTSAFRCFQTFVMKLEIRKLKPTEFEIYAMWTSFFKFFSELRCSYTFTNV